MKNFHVEQPIAFDIIKKAVDTNSVSHAYLINTNRYPFAWDFVLEMVKFFLCSDHEKEDDCLNCDLCRRIDNDNYPEFKIVDSDGMWIKKNQVLDLQNDFNRIALEGKKRVYVIKNADKMNQQTSNSILKFLEEPTNDVIAVLVTDNLNLLLPTIVSRCQLINLKNNLSYSDKAFENYVYLNVESDSEFDNFIKNADNKKFFDDIIDFIKYYEDNGIMSIVYSKDIWHSKFKDRIELVRVMDLIINFYYDVLLYKSTNEINFFKDYKDLINKISLNNEVNDLIRKLSVSIECKDKIKYNVNFNLFFDKYIMLLGGIF